jgi:hypothetical protein
MEEGTAQSQDQAVAICSSMYDNKEDFSGTILK